MRIISQDGLYDVPYEALAIRFHENDRTIILGVPLSVVSMDLVSDVPLITLVIYSTETKAQKAMEMLRNVYLEYEKGMSTEYWFAFNFPKIFQFPQDEDVEV